MSFKKCTTCKGSGIKVDVKGEIHKCLFCNGEGVVPMNRILHGMIDSSRLKVRKTQLN
jgi:DnaJ-class molecular chaperone